VCCLPENAKHLIKESLVSRAGGMYATLFSFSPLSLT
jgi:hypothetical protein